jgi:hypothetical protein
MFLYYLTTTPAGDNWNFSIDNYGTVWAGLIQVVILLVALFLGNLLRNVIPFLRESLISSSLWGCNQLLQPHDYCRAVRRLIIA